MRQADDRYTLELLPRPGRGRPRKADALTPAQRAKAYRMRKKRHIELSVLTELTLKSLSTWFFPGAQPGSLADQHGHRQP